MTHLMDDAGNLGVAVLDGRDSRVVEIDALDQRLAALEARVAVLEGRDHDHAPGIDEAELAGRIAAAMDKRANEHAPTEVWTFPPRGAS